MKALNDLLGETANCRLWNQFRIIESCQSILSPSGNHDYILTQIHKGAIDSDWRLTRSLCAQPLVQVFANKVIVVKVRVRVVDAVDLLGLTRTDWFPGGEAPSSRQQSLAATAFAHART